MFLFVPTVSFCPNQTCDCGLWANGRVKRDYERNGAKRNRAKQRMFVSPCSGMKGRMGGKLCSCEYPATKGYPERKSLLRLEIRHHRDVITCSSGTPPGLPADPEAPWTDRPAPETHRTAPRGICGSSCNGRRQGRHLRDGDHHRQKNG